MKPKKAPAKSKGKAKAKSQTDDHDSVVPTPKANGKVKAEFKNTIPDDATAGSAQYAKSEKLIVPVDEAFPFNGYVYIDNSSRIIYVNNLSFIHSSVSSC